MINKGDQLFDLIDMDEYNWTAYCDNVWELLTAILLDTRTPLERMKTVIQRLKERKLLDYRELSKYLRPQIAVILKTAGYPWYNQKAEYFRQVIRFDLEKATWEELQEIKGIGPKLASLWMRIVHGLELPIIDTHVKRWLFHNGYEGSFNDYTAMSSYFTEKAKEMHIPISTLDRLIVSEGIVKRRGRQ